MSPTAFKQQVAQLISHLTRCYELCDNIIANRRISERHEHLNNLRAGLKAACSAIQIEFNTLRKVLGSRMDLGDDPARHALNRNIRELEIDIEARLYDIASRRTDGLPGFRDMLRKVQGIEDGSKDIIEDLGERLRAPPMPIPIARPTTTPKPTEKPATPRPATPKPKKTDEVVMSVKELEKLLSHVKSCWEERNVAGKTLYVNCFDDTRRQWERPEGFIKSLPKVAKPPRTPSWEQEPFPRRVRRGSWERTSGW